MQQSVDEMRVALRVLDALTSHQTPDPADVRDLWEQSPVGAKYSLDSLDELACEVIQQALRHRTAALENKHRIV
jgi:hypothetical protein